LKYLSGDAVWVSASPREALAVGLQIHTSAQVTLKVQDCTAISLKTRDVVNYVNSGHLMITPQR